MAREPTERGDDPLDRLERAYADTAPGRTDQIVDIDARLADAPAGSEAPQRRGRRPVEIDEDQVASSRSDLVLVQSSLAEILRRLDELDAAATRLTEARSSELEMSARMADAVERIEQRLAELETARADRTFRLRPRGAAG